MIAMGTVMEIDKSKALVFTVDGNVVYVKPRLGLFVGQQIAFTKREVMTAQKRLLAVLPYAAMAAALLVVACIATGMFGMNGLFLHSAGQQCAAYIALDINPSIQFKIDEEGRVLSVSALNDDGGELIKSMNLTGKLVEQAVEEAIAKAKELGYIKDSSSVVLIAGALNDGNSNVSGRRSEYRSKLESMLGSMGNNGDADVLALYIDDSSVKKNAEKNKLSLGRELLKEYAAQNNITLADDDIRSGKIDTLIDKVSNPEKCLPFVTSGPTATPEETATAAPTESPTDKPTDIPTEEPTQKPTVEPTDAPTPKPTDTPAVTVAAKAYGTGIQVSWKKAPAAGSKFLYYKVVFSVKDASPRYPDNGYVKVVSDIATLSAVIKPGAACSGGDFSSVKAGATYYISVTVVYEGGSIFGNTVRVKCPSAVNPTTPPSTGFDGTVNASASGDHINISWDKAPESDGFCYYKVVFSKSDNTPRYPDNGYLYAISDRDDTSCSASPGQCYNGGGEMGELEAGVTYYISVTYVYDDKKLYGSVKHVKMPGTPTPTATPVTFSSPTVSANRSGNCVTVSWTKLPAKTVIYNGDVHSGFQYYKIVASTSANPRYGDGDTKLLTYFDSSKISKGSCIIDITDYGSYFQQGETYYFSVSYLFSSGGNIYASDDAITIPALTPDPTPTPTPSPTPTPEPTPTPTT